jgi:thiol-disulfide isomerase/thioredoxin
MSSSPSTRSLRRKGAAVLLAAALAVTACGDDDDGGGASGDGTDQTSSESPEPTLGIAPVEVEGDALPEYDQTAAVDPAVGMTIPRIQGTTPVGGGAVIGPAQDQTSPTVIAVLAHWCPHCQAEVPRIVEFADTADLPEGTRFMALATNTNENAPNYPPGEWLEEEGWPGPVVLDDAQASGGLALGLPSFPYVIVIDGEGRVVGRFAGDLDDALLLSLLEEAAAATPA